MNKSHPQTLISLINNRIHQKYQSILSFYQARSINQILAANPHCTTYMDFCDLRILSEDISYLKRVYYYRTLTGKPEIQQRMKVICQYYATNPALSTFTYEYPMMILTNTKSLFIRRKRRLRKIQAGQGSSDFTEQHEQQYLQFQPKSENFLQDLQNSIVSEEQEPLELSYQSGSHNIYSQAAVQAQIPKIKLQFNQESLKHLIQDFNILNLNERLQINFDGELPSASASKYALTNIENRLQTNKESLFSIIPLEEKPKLEKKEKRESLLGNMITHILQRPINFSSIGLKMQQAQILGLNSEHQSLEKQKEERAYRRQQIRQKAEDLLRKVRNTVRNEQ